MRLVTYDSVRRRMVRVVGEGAAPSVPTSVTAGGVSAGTLTSAIDHTPGRWIGLAVLRSEFARGEPALDVGGRSLGKVEALLMPRAAGRS